MNILYVGNAQGFRNAGKYYMIPQKLINGFTRNGHNVYIFNDRDVSKVSNIFGSSRLGRASVNKALIETCKAFRPALVVLGHCEQIGNETLQDIRRVVPGVKIIYRNVDPLHTERNVAAIRNRALVVDGIFVTTAGDSLKQFVRPDCFICFMPNPIDPSIEAGRAFEQDGQCDVFFAGGALRDQHDQREDILLDLRKSLPQARLEFHHPAFGRGSLFGHAYMEALGQSRMGLCLNKNDEHYLYASDRMAQYLGNGMLVILDRRSGFSDLFEEDEVAFFSTREEIGPIIQHYLSDDAARRCAAKKGWAKAQHIFDCTRIARYIVEKSFGQALTEDFPWPTVSY